MARRVPPPGPWDHERRGLVTFTHVTGRRRPTVGSVLVVLVFLVVLAGCGSSSSTTAPKNTTATTPTNTTEAPAPSPTESFDKQYGTFTAVTKQGSGDSVIDLPTGAKAGLVTATHTGDANFAIKDLDAENKSVDLLVNTIGAYNGTTAWGFGLSRGKSVKLEVTASGAWTIKLAPIGSAPFLGNQNSGKGDAVCLWTGSATNWAITNKGQGNFVVKANGKGLLGTDLLVNGIGNYDATKAVKAGPAVSTIESDGDWTIAASGANAGTGCGASTNGGASSSGGASSGASSNTGGTAAPLPNHCSAGLSTTQGVPCELANNTFYEYYKAVQSGKDTTALMVWSPGVKQYRSANCSKGSGVITCHISGTNVPNAQVQITQAALDAYTPQHASEYARTHDLGPRG